MSKLFTRQHRNVKIKKICYHQTIMINQNQTIFLSPSKLNLFEECPLCFWLHMVKGIHRPESPASTLPRGMDQLIKKYFDRFRKIGKMPPEIKDKVKGKLLNNQVLLNEWRKTSKSSAPRFFDKSLNAYLFGGLDECFVDNNYFIPVDYKTRGFELKDNSLSYYQTQLDCYTFLLETNGYQHLSFGYLIYYIPAEVKENGEVRFNVAAYLLKTNSQRGYNIFKQAVLCLRQTKPKPSVSCQFCSFGAKFNAC